MSTRNCLAWASALGLSLPLILLAQPGIGPTVRFSTTLGDIDVVLYPSYAPRTVANFMNYLNRGDYNNSFFHRSSTNFVIQGGGYWWKDGKPAEIPEDDPIRNEFNLSNVRGTLAMAKLDTGPDTATNQWFFNLRDTNAATLNKQNGGFTVFGRIDPSDTASLAVMDKIAAVPKYALESPFGEIPLVDYTSGEAVQEKNLVIVKSITVLGQNPAISNGGIVTASAFGNFPVAAPGSYIEIYGANLGPEPGRGWAESDFTDGNAPTTLETVSVTVGGRPAFVNYVSPGQVNVQIPDDVGTGTVPVVVDKDGLSSAGVQLEIRARAPGLLAPASFQVGEKQYVVAIRPDGSFVSNGSIPGLPARPAAPGETLVFYGTGFGPVSGSVVAGRVATGQTTLATPIEFRFGNALAEVPYKGLSPGLVGVYQFNVVVPADAENGDLALQVRLGGEPIGQTLFIPVQR